MEDNLGNTAYNVNNVQPNTDPSDSTTISSDMNMNCSGYHSGGINLGAKGNGGTQLQIDNKLFFSIKFVVLYNVVRVNWIIMPNNDILFRFKSGLSL